MPAYKIDEKNETGSPFYCDWWLKIENLFEVEWAYNTQTRMKDNDIIFCVCVFIHERQFGFVRLFGR